MDITSTAIPPIDARADLLAVALHQEALPSDALVQRLDDALGGALRRAITDERFTAKQNQVLEMHTLGRLGPARVALIGVGPATSAGASVLQAFGGGAARLASRVGASQLALVPPATDDPSAQDTTRLAETAHALGLGVALGAYRFDRYVNADQRKPSVTSVQVCLGDAASDPIVRAALARATNLARAVTCARDLVNEPAGVLTPSALAEVARTIARDHGLAINVLGRQECAAEGMGLFLAVAQGSTQEPRFIHLAHKPAVAKQRIVLVGKGVTFDSGGLSLKTNDGMLDMKTDMAGAAAVLSVMKAVAAEALPIEVHALAACTENMPSGTAYKLGDVLRAKSGKTVEINNTDAEGRLTLADAITYGLNLQPNAIFDFATLTGACVVALGPHTAGVMSNDTTLKTAWLAAAVAAGEDMWPLPLPERLGDQLKSDIADMKNTGEKWGGALTAGLFLREFVGDAPWVHVDLAGPASADKEFGHIAKGGTGFGVATIFEYLRRLS